MNSYSPELDSSLEFLKEKGVDYKSYIPDESRFSGEANQKYINDEKKMFTLNQEEDISGTQKVTQRIVSKESIVVGILKKSDSIILNAPLDGKSIYFSFYTKSNYENTSIRVNR